MDKTIEQLIAEYKDTLKEAVEKSFEIECKKLKELQAENEELKQDLHEVENACCCFESENADLRKENERLKEENYQLQKDCQICENFIDFIPCKPIRDMDYDLQKVISQRDNYYQALQEIREIVDENKDTAQYRGICLSIIDKINEVIGVE